jgi:hypothetical protein
MICIKRFSKMFPQKHLTVLRVINACKEKKLTFSAKFRCNCNGIQGCFTFVKFKGFIDDGDDDEPIGPLAPPP